MYNREIYYKDPSDYILVNKGVANVNDGRTHEALAVLRHELETFVCDGQYRKGIDHILETYLKNLDWHQQPAVWVSGFFGSGKSHIVKMLRALWEDTVFEDGSTAREIANIPQSIQDNLTELSKRSEPCGGVHAASGMLDPAASGSVRLALLRIIFKSAGLPCEYQKARFLMWLKSEGIYDTVYQRIRDSRLDWDAELDNLHVAEDLHAALMHARPNQFPSFESCVETLNNMYPHIADISNDDMVHVMHQAVRRGKQFPLTLVVLDEVQQFIGDSSKRSVEIQEMVESCCKCKLFQGRLLFIGTGQTAVTGTRNLKKLEGRFSIRVEFSDADVDAVIRKVILSKKTEAEPHINEILQTSQGEISRHLNGTSIAPHPDDGVYFSQDYPILPVRRRFWETMIHALDPTGTENQLRNRLSMIHNAIQTNLDKPLGNVLPADHLFFYSAEKLLQSRILPRKIYEQTTKWYRGTSQDERLMGRACSLVFLISMLSRHNKDVGIRATIDTIADLMVENLSEDSVSLRSKLPKLLDGCDLLMRIGDEYRIQTDESTAWNDDFQCQRARLSNDTHKIETKRNDLIREAFLKAVPRLHLIQGSTQITRDILPVFDPELPEDADQQLCVWVRDGWNVDEQEALKAVRKAGNHSPTVFVLVPKRLEHEMRHCLIERQASRATMDKRVVPNTPEGREARDAMQTVLKTAERRIEELLQGVLSEARVFQGGGTEIHGDILQEMILKAAGNALHRLYPQFHVADHAGWLKVYERSRKGSSDALVLINYQGNTANHPVCKIMLNYIGDGKSGSEIRAHFESPPFGWHRDAIDGGLQMLLTTKLAYVQSAHGGVADAKALERRLIGKTQFRVETVSLSTSHLIQIRQLFHKADINIKKDNELTSASLFLEKMRNLAARAGGDAPKPDPPDTAALEQIGLASGNKQLFMLYQQREMLSNAIGIWSERATHIEQRMPNWKNLVKLINHNPSVRISESLIARFERIRDNRQLLAQPDPVAPMLEELIQNLRECVDDLVKEYDSKHCQGIQRLADSGNWKRLDPDQQDKLLSEQHLALSDRPAIALDSPDEILETLERYPLSHLEDRVAAMPARFESILVRVLAMTEPALQHIPIPMRVIKSDDDAAQWIDEVSTLLKATLNDGPILFK